MFSAVSSAFIIDIYKQLQPDPSDQTTALLRAILLTLNHSAIPNEAATVPAVQQNPPGEIVLVNCLLFASLLISLLAAFAAMLGKQWLNRYSRHAPGGSISERCGDRQRKFDGLQRWPFHFIIESLPVMLQIALLLLACGLCRYIMAINTPVAWTLITLTSFGVLFYLVVVIVGASSYDCPFQTPGSALLRSSWKTLKKVGPHLTLILLPITNTLPALSELLRRIQLGMLRIGFFLPQIRPSIRLPRIRLNIHLPRIRLNIRHRVQDPPLPTTREGSSSSNSSSGSYSNLPEIIPWFEPGDLAIIQKKNTDNVRCVSWVLKDITDPETLDAAILLAGTIWWFEDGIDVKPHYDLIVSTFHMCFGSDGELHQGLRNRAYYSARAILWIHTLAVCHSEGIVHMFPLPERSYGGAAYDHDLEHLLRVFRRIEEFIEGMLNPS